MPHPVPHLQSRESNSKGLIIFGACAVVAVAVVVIEEWPTIKQTYQEVRAAQRRRRLLSVQSHTHTFPRGEEDEQEPMMTSGIHEPAAIQEMTMRSRNTVPCPPPGRWTRHDFLGGEEWDTSSSTVCIGTTFSVTTGESNPVVRAGGIGNEVSYL